MQRPPARAAADDLDALTRTFEPEPREEALPQREPERNLEPAPSPKPESQTGSLPSCEGAAATADQTIDVGSSRRAPDLTRGATQRNCEKLSHPRLGRGERCRVLRELGTVEKSVFKVRYVGSGSRHRGMEAMQGAGDCPRCGLCVRLDERPC